MATLHQSDLSSWARCAAQVGYKRAGLPSKTNSAAAFGSVVHHSLLQVLERQLAAKVPFEKALADSIATFLYYWSPSHIEAICPPVPNDGWLPRMSYNDLRVRGPEVIRQYADLIRFDPHQTIATEYEFVVPIDGTWDEDEGRPHRLAGAIDKLAIGQYNRAPVVEVKDLKTGKAYPGDLRHNLQFSAYCYATTKREFWIGWNGEDGFGEERGQALFERFEGKARRGTWINLRSIKLQDAGWRGPIDYERFALAVQQIYLSMREDIYPLTLAGDVCTFCSFRDGCGGVGVPDDDHGSPVATKKRSAA